MSAFDTHQLATNYLQSLAARDIAALVACFADVVDWDVPGAQDVAPWVGRRRQRAEIQQFFELLFAHTVPVDASVEHLVVDGPVAIVTGSFSSLMTQSNRQYTSPFSLQMRLEQGKIVQYRLLEDTHALVLALT